MNNGQEGTILAQSSESRKYPMIERVATISSSSTNDFVVVGGHSPDGKGIMYCLGSDGNLKWSQPYPQPISTVGVSARGTFVGIGGVDNIIYYFTAVGELAWTDDCRSDVKFMTLSSDGRFICIGLADGNINFYDNDIVAARKFVWKHRFDKPVSTLTSNMEGTLVGAGTEEGEIAIFTERGDLTWTKLLDGKINKIVLAPEGDAVVVACSDNKLRFYSAEIGRTLWSADGGGVFIDTDITRRGERAVGINKDDFVYCYDKAGTLLWKYDLQNPGEKVAIAADGKTVVASTIDTQVHCLDAKGNLLWRFKAGGSGVSGLMVSEDGDMVVVSSDAGVLFFDNLQVIGGILPKIRHEISKGKERNVPTFKTEKYYEEAVVALNYGDYLTAAQKVREIEAVLYGVAKPAPSPEEPPTTSIPPLPAPPSMDGPPVDEKAALTQKLREEIDEILRESEELKTKGVDVEPVENLLGEAMVLLEEGDPNEAEAYINDSKEMLVEFRKDVPEKPAEPPPADEPKGNKADAMEAIEKASDMMEKLENTDITLDTVKADILTAKNLIGTAEFQRAIAAANRAIITIEKALDPYLAECLMNVSKLKNLAENEGVDTTEANNMLMRTNEHVASGDYIGALEVVRESEEWLEDAIKAKKEAEPEPVPEEQKPPITIPPPPTVEITEEKEPEDEPEEKEPEDEAETPPTPPVEAAKPSLDIEKISADGEEPSKVLDEAEEALQGGDYPVAVEKYMIAMEALELKARTVVEQAIDKAKESIEKVKEDGFDTSEAEGDLENAENDLASGNYKVATQNALSAMEKSDSAAMAEINKAIEESRRSLKMATELGVDIAIAEDMIRSAQDAIGRKDFNVAVEFADKGVAEVEKASNEFIAKILAEGKDLLDKATEIGADTDPVKGIFAKVQTALDEKDFVKAHEGAKEAVTAAGGLPKKFVQGKISVARGKVLSMEKMGADTMMAKNFLIRARSSMAAGDFSGAMKACEKCIDEADKAPKNLVNKRIAVARNDMENVKSMGQNTDDIEGMLDDAEAKAGETEYEEALALLEEATSKLSGMKDIGKEITDLLFDVDMAVVDAAESGKDVTEAKKLLDEAFQIRSQDPEKAKELAEQIKKLLEG